MKSEIWVRKLKEAKKQFIQNHPLGKLTIAQLSAKAHKEDILVYGDKAQMLQCFTQAEYLRKIIVLNEL